MNPLEWKELSRSTVYDGRIFTAETVIRESYDGKTAPFTVLRAPDWVNIIAPVTAADGAPSFLMVRQFRQGNLKKKPVGAPTATACSDSATPIRHL